MPTNIPASSLDFLKQLKENNNREWFNDNKDLYLKEYDAIEKFAESLLQELRNHDVIETVSGKKSLHRIYRDTRFSKDKHLTKPTGVVALKEQLHCVGEVTIFISNPATVL